MSHNTNYDQSLCPVLRVGSSGPAVMKLQKCLLNMGFNPGKIDGVFGSLTKTAVMSFQTSKKLAPDGIVGMMTWTALGVNCNKPPVNRCPLLRESNTGPAVVTLQGLLKTAGFSAGKIDGVFGPMTKAAVVSFQTSKKLVPDGIVGMMTWKALGVNCS